MHDVGDDLLRGVVVRCWSGRDDVWHRAGNRFPCSLLFFVSVVLCYSLPLNDIILQKMICHAPAFLLRRLAVGVLNLCCH